MTVVEMLVAIGIFILLMGAIVEFIVSIYSSNNSISGSFYTIENAQTILKTMAKELRMMSRAANGAYPLAEASSSNVAFYADVNGDGTVEEIKYFLASGNMNRGVINPSGAPVSYSTSSEIDQVIIPNVATSSMPIFQYYDENYDGETATSSLADPVSLGAVRLVRINITLNPPVGSKSLPKSYTTQVMLRNLKDNL